MKLPAWLHGLILLAALGLSAAVARADTLRFSRQLTAAEATEVGLGRLSPDQLAVLDALVRRDLRINARPDPAHPQPLRFSERLLPEERRSSGLDLLTPAELARLDERVALTAAGGTPSVRTGRASSPLADPEDQAPKPEIHGMVSLFIGGGHGFSERGGSMVIDLQDPAHGLDLLVGYGETRFSGPLAGRGWCLGAPR